ncbi:hypothetical protein GLOIN_2v1606589 [Rhizophagus irregularis DAOM 181602=DAOM 197198]|uniref:Uncharacterized protein n=1 Tax=Rhizophagus irregularis (strain DAOM 181602 / DAOM 197198 / MUCL 43194) TaxID=747089 RepID=A0A2P4Q103_RHIID|nr:hypothetical protein GLOIN_2v1606589 [Rhizophagus irregularis DAOM 181602=DAOM 197198]POG71310.1 hypothetical protein GLOIN_2v1606589 [Rhizophagus irregularis DAOM 181602=DAOM 197198]|eukprot:XP_025178176.1 hypothetical protein GLOIN_2v1606589 [Rhizophagus irregularis DAOM 181602=DAOM 197198]
MDRKDAILYYFDIEKDNNLAFHTPKLPLPKGGSRVMIQCLCDIKTFTRYLFHFFYPSQISL